MIRIILNGEPCDIRARDVDTALAELELGEGHVATALNGEFVPRSERRQKALREGDRLEVLAPMQGG